MPVVCDGAQAESEAERYQLFFGDVENASEDELEEAEDEAHRTLLIEQAEQLVQAAGDQATVSVFKILAEEVMGKSGPEREASLLAVTAATTLAARAGVFDSSISTEVADISKHAENYVRVRGALLISVDGDDADPHDVDFKESSWPTQPTAQQRRYTALAIGGRLVGVKQRGADGAIDELTARRALDAIAQLIDACSACGMHADEATVVEAWVDDKGDPEVTPFAYALAIRQARNDATTWPEICASAVSRDGPVEFRYHATPASH